MGYVAVIPAAGLGKRMGYDYNKIFIQINDIAIIQMTVRQFENDGSCDAIYLAARKDELESMRHLFADSPKVKGIYEGGKERQDSIYNVLKQIPPCDHVLIHDGARPFVSQDILFELYQNVRHKGAVICGVNVIDTIKKVEDGKVSETIPREKLFVVHTPQAFSYDLIMQAYEAAERNDLKVTDDSSMVEALGKEVHVVSSNYDNIKITTMEDLIMAESIIKRGADQHV
ncbi:2-C-methyl-D-erythritol 4-phosphate cytidylyltransferase [Salinicoccus hispanicus]|uniref:2-C-methyl-D-erythritol 4-phosphate cytidylyltransferase n=1 Tax=Salinicoccus hispanicus TaxID=157225 RepID=A0A6N8U145_9STAP|nr:2-C-methyl-D-erythritol 4-phosphate cytidylyltransferase [Salinicoccus hispanicus]MXQ51472.1 2-C-methyl-D-erythritol 4-phosphate cytidylyltransferase [Salinicoccus hispanicus]